MIVTDKHYYMEKRLAEKLDLLCLRCTGNRKLQNLLITDGGEGYGKTTMSVEAAYYISQVTGRKFNNSNIFFDVNQMIDFALKTEDQILIWDEAALAGLSMESYNKIQIKLIKLLMIARKKRHFYIFNIPEVFRLKEPIVSRAIGLVHVYARNEVSLGRFVYFKKKGLAKLYESWIRGRKKLYKSIYSFRGSFPDALGKIVDEELYDKEKDKAILSISNEHGVEQSAKEMEVKKLKVMIGKVRTPVKTRVELANQLGVSDKTLRLWMNIDLNNRETTSIWAPNTVIRKNINNKGRLGQETSSNIEAPMIAQ